MKALTVQVGIFGRTNVGKSSLMNFITNQDISIISEIAGTTTDIVCKQMELNPVGPLTLFDTAGMGDKSVLGKARVEKTHKVFDFSDIAILVCEAGNFGSVERRIFEEIDKRKTPCAFVVSKTDLRQPDRAFLDKLKKYTKHVFLFSAVSGNRDIFLNALKKFLVEVLPDDYIEGRPVLGNIVKKDDTVILVMPVDSGAPRGKIIMPQVQILRRILDLNAVSYIVQDAGFEVALQNLKTLPALAITDSQVVRHIAEKIPSDVKLTTFSTIYAADKSDIVEMAKGAAVLNNLKEYDRILIAEACTHHASRDDIGRVKIPRWLKEYTGKNLEIKYVSGQDYPKSISDYRVVIHCGGCTLNRKSMLSRLNRAVEAGVPITNYGIAISVFHNIIEKVLEVFPEALRVYKKRRADLGSNCVS